MSRVVFWGSSGISGECSPDFQEEVFVISESVGHSLDALDQAGMQRPLAVREDAREVGRQPLREGDERLDPAAEGLNNTAHPPPIVAPGSSWAPV